MNVLLEIIGICTLLGTITGLISSLFLSDKENPWFTLIITLLGSTISFWYSIIWIFLTEGTGFSALMIFGCIVTTIVFLIITIPFISGMNKYFIRPKKGLADIISLVLLFGIALFLMFSAMPAFSSIQNTTPISTDDENYRLTYDKTVDEDLFDTFETANACLSCSPIPVEMNVKRASVNFPFFTANPSVNDYLGFDVTFDVGTSGGAWNKPYIKIIVFHDEDGSGDISQGDSIWSPSMVKIGTTNTLWKTNLVYQSGSPYIQLHYATTNDGQLFMPIFRLSQISQWKDDANVKFPNNTPEGYTSPTDQLSWDLSDNQISLKEDINSFASVPKGSSTTIKGSVYCHTEYSGTNFIWVGAYDLNFQSNPFNSGAGNPLMYKTEKFVVGEGPSPPDEDSAPPDVGIDISAYIIGATISIGSLGAIVYGRKFL